MPIDLTNIAAGNGGFVIYGQDVGDQSGWSVSSAGDVNGDGFDDLVIGAKFGNGPGNTRTNAGDTYVVFGHAGAFAAEIDLVAMPAGTEDYYRLLAESVGRIRDRAVIVVDRLLCVLPNPPGLRQGTATDREVRQCRVLQGGSQRHGATGAERTPWGANL